MPIDAPSSIGLVETLPTDTRQPEDQLTFRNIMRTTRTVVLTAICTLPCIESNAADAPVTFSAVSQNRTHQLEKTTVELRATWKEMHDALTRKGEALEREYGEQLQELTAQRLTGNVKQLEKGWDKILMTTFNREHGKDHTTIDGILRCYDELEALLQRNRWLMPEKDTGIDQALINESSLHSLNAWRISKEEEYKATLLTDETGARLRPYPDELAKDPTLTPEKYVELLGRRLRTPHDVAMFLKLCFHYTFDTDDVHEPLKKGTRTNHFDYDQTVEETLKRTEDGKMLGDCEDQAELCKAILEQMGIHAAVVFIPGEPESHCTCVWLAEKNGKFMVGDLGTMGYYLDGQLIESSDFSVTPDSHIREPIGKPTKEEAMQTGLQHFDGADGLSLATWNEGREILIQKNRSEFSRNQPWEARWRKLTMTELTDMLSKPPMQTLATAEVPGPPEE